MHIEQSKWIVWRRILAKLMLAALIGCIYVYRSLNDFNPGYVCGDGFEYIFMTEAIHNHSTPEITLKDVNSFKDKLIKYEDYNNFFKKAYVEEMIAFFNTTKAEFKETKSGLYATKDKKWYSYHFWFYSYLNIPAYNLFSELGPLKTFYITNSIFVILTILVILFFTPFSFYNQLLAALCFSFSSCYWYLGWQHVEVLSACLVTIGLIFFFNARFYLAAFILALACLQTQPLMLLLAFVGAVTIFKKGFNFKNIVITGLICSIGFIPQVFYYVHFGTTNLVKDAGFLDTAFITVNRVSGFFTDLNQGVILAIPLILVLYLPLLALQIRSILRKEEPFDFAILIPFVSIGIAMGVSTMWNWNHGMAIINRYAAWACSIIMVHVFYLVHRLNHERSIVIFNYFFMTQLFSILYHQKYNDHDWNQNHHRQIAKWVFKNCPGLYNPDPFIFGARTLPYSYYLSEANSPYIFFDEKRPCKIMVHRNQVDKLSEFGVSLKQIQKIKEKISYNYDWGYIDVKDFKTTLSDEQIFGIIREKKIRTAYVKILSAPDWVDQINKKAQGWGKTVDEVMRADAEYVVELDEKAEKEEDK